MSDDDKIKHLRVVKPQEQGNKEAVEILTGLLEQAQRGEIVGFAYAAIMPSGDSQTQCTFTDNFQQLVGAMRILEFRMMDESRKPQ